MTRNVVAVDATVYYASVARLVEGEPAPRCGGVITKDIDGVQHHLAAEARKHREFAERITDRILKGGAPELVVLRKPEVGNARTDPSGVRRLGVFWELVRNLDDASIPVAEVPLYTVARIVGAPVHDYTALAARLMELYPEAKLPEIEGTPDPRYRVSTIGLAAVGAVVAGIETPLTITDVMLDTARRGGDYPPRFIPAADAERHAARAEQLKRNREQDKRSRAEAWYERQLEDIAKLPMAELTDRFGERGPRNQALKAAWKRRVERESAR
ncbi:hypothetical protein [Mycobacterium avium]|uniref:hypothetical protein n=1 Tax=Mycobacterium avium TaxID=1764 RepID=UPI0003D22581|nr:hypothetical protein [Mycobacterium avium]ETA93281.1 hypothetical protein O984_09430 [Mycobacterium avium 05-4293]